MIDLVNLMHLFHQFYTNNMSNSDTIIFSAMLFSGRENAISLTREYYHDYACPFELSFYPFDTQVRLKTQLPRISKKLLIYLLGV